MLVLSFLPTTTFAGRGNFSEQLAPLYGITFHSRFAATIIASHPVLADPVIGARILKTELMTLFSQLTLIDVWKR
jgi:hypothetical protein